jgi:hypothetical protein
MRIVFLSGFLEPGRCGVGDYSRRLAGELIKQGHQAAVIALNDKFLNSKFQGVQRIDGVDVPVLRLPSNWSSKDRFGYAREWIEEYNPDWLSLQFVLFSYNERGLPFGLSKYLYSLGRNRKWHIMFHELWLGLEKECGLKMILWGAAQRRIIQSILRKLKVESVHTQTQLHQLCLRKLGVTAQLLPLISNIPVINTKVRKANMKNENVFKELSFVIFGSLYGGAPVATFLSEVSNYMRKSGVQISLVFIGRNRANPTEWIEGCKLRRINMEMLGEQAPETVSKILAAASLGISTTPFALAEKSGAIAAMHAHGVPVLCVSRPFTPRGKLKLKLSKGITEYTEGGFETFINNIKTVENIVDVKDVAAEYDQALHCASARAVAITNSLLKKKN